MTTLAYESPFRSRPERRLTTFVVASLGALVVPVLAATGLALPLPSVIYRLAVDVARTTESVTLRVGGFAVDLGGGEQPAPPGRIVLTHEERHAGADATAVGAPAQRPDRAVAAARPSGTGGARKPSSVVEPHRAATAAGTAATSPSHASPKDPIPGEAGQDESPAPSPDATAPAEPAPSAEPTPPAQPTTPADPDPPVTRASPGVRTPAEPAAPAANPTASKGPPVGEPAEPAPGDRKDSGEKVAEQPVDAVIPPLPPVAEDTVDTATENARTVVADPAGTVTDSVPALPAPRNPR